MANHISSLKRVRITERRTKINRMRKSHMRLVIRSMRKALEKKDLQEATGLLGTTFSAVDRAAKWGIIKTNTADRYKARLHKRLKSLAGAKTAA
jgi:small subunit ribosomal protein S20